jgi:dephospho-CoA kinase
MPKHIIGFVGLRGCGKGTAADVLRKEYQADYYRFSAIIRDIADKLAIPHSRENFTKISEMVRATFGQDRFAYALEKEALASQKEIVVIDGIRRMEDIVALKPLPQFKLIAIEVPIELRYERIRNRGERPTEKDMTWDAFLADEKCSTELTIPEVMSHADITISNHGTKEEFEKQLKDIFASWGIEKPLK